MQKIMVIFLKMLGRSREHFTLVLKLIEIKGPGNVFVCYCFTIGYIYLLSINKIREEGVSLIARHIQGKY